MVLFSPMLIVSGKFGPLSFNNKLCVYMHVNYWAPEVFSRVWRGAPAEEDVQTRPKPETAFEKPSAFSLQLSKTNLKETVLKSIMISPTLGKHTSKAGLYFPVKYLCLVSCLPFPIYPEERLLAFPSFVNSYPQCTMRFGHLV